MNPIEEDSVAQADTVKPEAIVVGVDGSEHGNNALEWAIAEARLRGASLRLVTAYNVPIFSAVGLDGGIYAIDDDDLARGAREVIKQAAQQVAESGVEYQIEVVKGDAAAVLLESAEGTDLLVCGSRGRGGFLGRMLGSVSSALPAHAPCPTVVVPLHCAERVSTDGHQAEESVVTVGVDGSTYARYAVLVAAEEAMLRGYRLRILCALPPLLNMMSLAPLPPERERFLEDIQTQLKSGEAWLSSHFPKLPIETQWVDGTAAEQLITATESSELVVMGSRGRGGFAGMILGSTTDTVLHHTKGPLMVVRNRDDERLANRADFGPLLGGAES